MFRINNLSNVKQAWNIVDSKPPLYDWLENPDSDETVAYCNAQNKITHAFLDQFPSRDQLKDGFEKANNYAKYGVPFRGSEHSPFYYFWHNSGLQNQYVLYQADNAMATVDEAREFINLNKMDPAGTVRRCLEPPNVPRIPSF